MYASRSSKRLAREENATVKLVLLRDTRLKIRGGVTGQEYFFNGAGSIVDVDRYDAQIMLNKVQSKSCCGSVGSPIFQLLE